MPDFDTQTTPTGVALQLIRDEIEAPLKAEISRLREMNTQLFERRQSALRAEDAMRVRAEQAESDLRDLRADR